MNSVRDYHHNAVADRAIRCVVFDFGGTLSFEPYFKLLGASALKQISHLVFGTQDPHIRHGWMTGLLSSSDVAEHLSTRIGLPADAILSALNEGCAQIGLNKAVWNFAQQQRGEGRKTALVTVNFDVFTDVIVPARGLDKVFDAIVNSSDYGAGDKEQKLWPVAFDLLGGGCGYSNSLLIEDSAQHVKRFRELGGVAYQYTNDDAFSSWLDEWSSADVD